MKKLSVRPKIQTRRKRVGKRGKQWLFDAFCVTQKHKYIGDYEAFCVTPKRQKRTAKTTGMFSALHEKVINYFSLRL